MECQVPDHNEEQSESGGGRQERGVSGRETIVSDCALCVECRLVRINAIPLVNLIKTLDSSQLLFAACLSLKHHRREPLLVQTITNREYLPLSLHSIPALANFNAQ